MATDQAFDVVDRRAFLGAGTASVLGLPSVAVAQQQPPAAGATPSRTTR